MRRLRVTITCLTFLSIAVALSATPLRVIATGDMHGSLRATPLEGQWLGGAAEMLAYWQQVEQYRPEDFLLLSCGDIITGPAIATVFQGDPVIAVMNRLGYDATTLGNHDFDFKIPRLEQWKQSARFPFLAANLTDADGNPTSLTAPYFIYEEQGVKVAVIGLILRDIFTFGNTDNLQAQAYAATLRKVVPEVREQGAQVVIVAAHVPFTELTTLAEEVADLNIPLMLGGHDHQFVQRKVQETWVVNSGLGWRGYSRVDLDYREATGTTTVLSSKQVWLLQDSPAADAELQAEIDGWQQRIDTEYGMPLGYTVTGLRRPVALYNLVADSWLAMDPQAQIALVSNGSLREDILPGTVTLGAVIGLLPFNNSILRLTLTGEQLLANLPKTNFIGMAGLRRQAGAYTVISTGKPIAKTARYRVLVSDYMYRVNRSLRAADANPVTVFADWRQPVRDWLLAHPTDAQRPLETIVDSQPRISR